MALAFVLTIGDVRRFRRGKQVASYLGLIPREESSGGRQKLGAISKPGNGIEDLVGHEMWIGDAAEIGASYVRKQKTDQRDAAHILRLLVAGRFRRLWAPAREQRDLRQLVVHRHKLVLIRARVKNELQHLSLNKGMQGKRRLWSGEGMRWLRG